MPESVQGPQESGNSMPPSVANPEAETAEATLTNIESPEDAAKHAKSLSDEALAHYVERSCFRHIKYDLAYLQEAHDRFCKQGRRIPVPGNPSWTEWVERCTGYSVRSIQLWLATSRKISPGRKKTDPKPKPNPDDTVRVELVLSKAEAEQLISAGKHRNPDDTYHGIFEAAVAADASPTGVHEAAVGTTGDAGDGERPRDVQGLFNVTYPTIAAVFAPLWESDRDNFFVGLRTYFQNISDRLVGGDRLVVAVVPNSEEFDEAA